MSGGAFAGEAARLAGFAGAVLGWSPAQFWDATPAELAAVVGALAGDVPVPADAGLLARLRAMHPDGGQADG